MSDLRELVGTLMRLADGGEATMDEIEALDFETDEPLRRITNAAYIELVEFVFDYDERMRDPQLDEARRLELKQALIEIGRFS